jgi:arylsulfatase
MVDDIGWFNASCYNHGVMGDQTPNIDRIAREGAVFTDFYAKQSCAAGRAAFITGQQPIRTPSATHLLNATPATPSSVQHRG